MGSACVKEESKVIEADTLVFSKEEVLLQSSDDEVLENGIEVDLKPKGNICGNCFHFEIKTFQALMR